MHNVQAVLEQIRSLRVLSDDHCSSLLEILFYAPHEFYRYEVHHHKKQCLLLLNKPAQGVLAHIFKQNPQALTQKFFAIFEQNGLSIMQKFENLDMLLSCGKRRNTSIDNSILAMADHMALSLENLFDARGNVLSAPGIVQIFHVAAKFFLSFEDRFCMLRSTDPSHFFALTKRMFCLCSDVLSTSMPRISLLNSIGLILSIIIEPWGLPVKISRDLVASKSDQSISSSLHDNLHIHKVSEQLSQYRSYTSRFFVKWTLSLSPAGLLCAIHGCLQKHALTHESADYVAVLIALFLGSHKDESFNFFILQAFETLCRRILDLSDKGDQQFLDVDSLQKIEMKMYEIFKSVACINAATMESIITLLTNIARKTLDNSKCFQFDFIDSNISSTYAFKYTVLDIVYAKRDDVRESERDHHIMNEAITYLAYPKLTTACSRLLITLASSSTTCMDEILRRIIHHRMKEKICRILMSKVVAPICSRRHDVIKGVLEALQTSCEKAIYLLTCVDQRSLKGLKVSGQLFRSFYCALKSYDSKARFSFMNTFLEIAGMKDADPRTVADFVSHNIRLENVFHHIEIRSFMKRLRVRSPEGYTQAFKVAFRQMYPSGCLERRFSIFRLVQTFSCTDKSEVIPIGVLLSSCFENWRDLRDLSYHILMGSESFDLLTVLERHESRLSSLLRSVKQTHSEGAAYLLSCLYIGRWKRVPASVVNEMIFADIEKLQVCFERSLRSWLQTCKNVHGIAHLLTVLFDTEFMVSCSERMNLSIIKKKSLELSIESMKVLNGLNFEGTEYDRFEPDCRGHLISAVSGRCDKELSALSWLSLKRTIDLVAKSTISIMSSLSTDIIKEAVDQIGIALLKSKHNGIIARCHAALVGICRACIEAESSTVNAIPLSLLNFVLGESGICSKEESRTLRRSQGLPFFTIAILESELIHTRKELFLLCMEEIISILRRSEASKPNSSTIFSMKQEKMIERQAINALNVLRMLLSTSALHGHIMPFIEVIFEIIYSKLDSASWSSRNSFIMTYAKLLACFIDDNAERRPTVYDLLERFPSMMKIIEKQLRSACANKAFFSIIVLERARPVTLPSPQHERSLLVLIASALCHAHRENALLRQGIANAVRNLAFVNIDKTCSILLKGFHEINMDQNPCLNSLHTFILSIPSVVHCSLQSDISHIQSRLKSAIDQLAFSHHQGAIFDMFKELLKAAARTLSAHDSDMKKWISEASLRMIYPTARECMNDPHFLSLVGFCMKLSVELDAAQPFLSCMDSLCKISIFRCIDEIFHNDMRSFFLQNANLRRMILHRTQKAHIVESCISYYKGNDIDELKQDLLEFEHEGEKSHLFETISSLLSDESPMCEWEFTGAAIKFIIHLSNSQVFISGKIYSEDEVALLLLKWSQPDVPECIRRAVTEAIENIHSIKEKLYSSYTLWDASRLLLSDNDPVVRRFMAEFISKILFGTDSPTQQTEVCIEQHYSRMINVPLSSRSLFDLLNEILPSKLETADIPMKSYEAEAIFDHESSNFFYEPILHAQYSASVIRYASQRSPLEIGLNELSSILSLFVNRIPASQKCPADADILNFQSGKQWDLVYRTLLYCWALHPVHQSLFSFAYAKLDYILTSSFSQDYFGKEITALCQDRGNATGRSVLFLLSETYLDNLCQTHHTQSSP